MKTFNRPNASIETRNHIASMESQVRRLFNVEPLVPATQRQQMFESLAELDVRLERLSLRSLTKEIDVSFLDDISACARDLMELDQSWTTGQARLPSGALGLLEAV